MDVGITDIMYGDFGGGGQQDRPDARRIIEELLAVKRPYVSLEDGSRYAGTLVIEASAGWEESWVGEFAVQLAELTQAF